MTSMRTSDEDIRDRVRGTLIGLAAGDRNGGPVRMAVRLAESLAERKGFAAADVFERYKDWMLNGAFDTGPVTGGVLTLSVREGTSSRHAAERVHRERRGYTAGCNTAHRIPPLAMAAAVADHDLAAHAGDEAALTHLHPLAADASAAVAILCRALIWGEAMSAALERAAVDRLQEIRTALNPDSDGEFGRGGFAPEALRAAVHFVSRGDGFGEALAGSLSFAGPANYCPVLVGAIAGARWGAATIPEGALAHCKIRARVEDAAGALEAGWKDEMVVDTGEGTGVG